MILSCLNNYSKGKNLTRCDQLLHDRPDGYIAIQAQSSLIQAPQKEPLFHHQSLLQFLFAPDKDVQYDEKGTFAQAAI